MYSWLSKLARPGMGVVDYSLRVDRGRMSIRRAMDSGRSPWIGMLVLIPIINLWSMLWLDVEYSTSASVIARTEIAAAFDDGSNQ